MVSTLFRGRELRHWQNDAIAHWNQYHKGIIQAVPGSGKTVLAIKSFCDELEKNSKLRVLIVCPRLTLIKQWTDEILENTNLKENDIYEISSKNEARAFKKVQDRFAQHKVFISTFNQIKQFFAEHTWKDFEWFLIVDEMHNTTEGYNFPDAPIIHKLGLSATPKKKGKSTTFNLGGIIYTYSFEQALADKIILEPEFKLILYSVDKQLFEKISAISDDVSVTDSLMEKAYDSFMHDTKVKKKKKSNKINENTAEENSTNLAIEETMQVPVTGVTEADFFTSNNVDYLGIQRILKEHFHIGGESPKQTLVFVNRIKKADLLNEMLVSAFKSPVSHSYHSQCLEYNYAGHFENISQKFEKNEFNVLISVSTLGEGIDFPYASHGILASPVHNPTSFVQKVGRLLRKYKDQEKAVIYYYVPSELISRLLSDPKITPNYLKAVLKIADEHKNLYFVDRKTLKEERGTLADLLSQGAAYERNEEIERLKIPKKLDSILRCFRRVYPKSFKHWKSFVEEDDFSLLETKIFEKYKTALFIAKNLEKHTSRIELLQEFVVHEKGYKHVKQIVEEALRLGIIAKIKYGKEVENFYTGKKSALDPAEQEMLITALKAEYRSFKKQLPETKKALVKLREIINVLKISSSSKEKKLNAMFMLAQTYFSLQSIFLDELDLTDIARLDHDEKFSLTIGKDLFVASAEIKAFAYPEDFGFSRWQEVEERPKMIQIELSPAQKLTNALFKRMEENMVIPDWILLKKELSDKENIRPVADELILHELEAHKFKRDVSLEKIFYATEAIKKAQKSISK